MEVRPGLHVGGWEDLGREAWTHVLSLDGGHVGRPDELGRDVKRMAVNLLDLPTENLLQHLTRCLGFITRALGGGGEKAKVLVHCHAGQSRSVAVVAAHLMRSEGLDLEQALRDIRRVSPNADPNEGFREQLELYLRMGCRIDVNNPLYRHHLLKQQGKNAVRGIGQPKTEAGAEAEAEAIASDSGTAGEGEGEAEASRPSEEYSITCRKCRSILAVSSQVIPHDPPHGPKARVPRKWQASGGAQPQGQCSSLYVEPLKWMEEVEGGANEGKLSCYKCKARVGHFSWSGMQCSCTQWVTPAFQLQKAKVDLVMT